MIRHFRRCKRLILLCALVCLHVITRAQAPVFVPDSVYTTYCSSIGQLDVSKFLKGSDANSGQTLTWTVKTAPSHGTLSGFPFSTTSNGGLVTPKGLTLHPNGNYAGTDTFTVKLSDGTSTGEITIHLTALASPVLDTIAGRRTLCEYSMARLTCSPAGGVWASSNTSIATIDAKGGDAMALKPGVSIISYTYSNGTCASSATIPFTVLAYPDPSAILGPDGVCTGNTIQLGNTVSGGKWNTSDSSIAIVDANGLLKGIAPGTATIRYTVTNGTCNITPSKSITVGTPPVFTAITGDSTLCVGTTSQLANTTTGGTWASSNTTVATISNSGLVSALAPGTSTISYSYGSGCTTTAKITLRVNNFTPTGAITGDTAICSGSTSQFRSVNPGGIWGSISKGGRASVNPTQGSVYGGNQGLAQVYYTLSNTGCSDTSFFDIKIKDYAIKFESFSWSGYTCTGGLVTINTTSNPSGYWLSSDTTLATVNLTGVPAQVRAKNKPGIVQITYNYDVPGKACVARSPHDIEVLEKPGQISGVPTNATLCTGTTLWSAVKGTGYTKLTVSDSSIATLQDNGYYLAKKQGTCSFVYTYANKTCQTIIVTTITVKAVPVLGTLTGAATLCTGNTTTLKDAMTGGRWFTSNATSASIDSVTGVITALKAGSTTIRHIYNNGTCADTSSKTISIATTPAIAPIAGSNLLCTGTRSTYTDSIPGGRWSSSNSAVFTVDSLGVVTAVSAGTATLSYVTTNGSCTSTATKSIFVSTTPDIAPVTGNNAVCPGTNLQLYNTTATITWSVDSSRLAYISNAGLLQAINPGKVTVRARIANSNCVNNAYKEVIIYPFADTPVITSVSKATFCSGDSTRLTASAASSYQWLNYGQPIAGANAASYITRSGGTYSVEATNTNGCKARSTTVSITVNAVPAVRPITGDTVVCMGMLRKINGRPIGGTWYSSNTSVATIDSEGIITSIKPGVTTMSYTISNGYCSATASTSVTVRALPQVQPVTGDTMICLRSAGRLYNATAGGNWFSGNTNIVNFSDSGRIWGWQAGTTTVRYEINDGYCYNTAIRNVTVMALPDAPVIAARDSGVLCRAGDSVILQSSAAVNQWLLNGTAITGATQNTYIVKNGGYYSTQTTSQYGCTSKSDALEITFRALPANSSITGTTRLCAGSTAQLLNATKGGIWSISDKAIAIINDTTGVIEGVKKGTAIVTYTTRNNYCTSPVSTTVTIGDMPAVMPITGNTTLCVNATTQLANAAGNGSWISSDSSIAVINATGVVTGVKAGTASISYTTANEFCSNTTAARITVNALPATPVITAKGNTAFCSGDSVVLTSSATTGNQWLLNGAAITTGTGTQFTARTAGNYSVKHTNANGCTAVSAPAAIALLAAPETNVTAGGALSICAGDTVSLTAAATSGTQWFKNNTAITGATATVLQITTAGDYQLQVTGTNGCKAVSQIYTVAVNPIPVINISSSAGSSITKGSTTQLTVTSSESIGTVSWTPAATVNFPASASVTVNPQETTLYTVRVSSVAGCNASDTITIAVVPVQQFSGRIIITPNGDGINDMFSIENVSSYADNELRIYDRSGKLVFEKRNYDNKWGGTSGQNLLTADTYFFVFSSQGKIIKKGSVTIVR